MAAVGGTAAPKSPIAPASSDPDDFKSRYSVGAKIDSNTQSVVRKVKHKATDNVYAAQIFNTKGIEEADLAEIHQSIKLLHEAQGIPGVVKVIEWYEQPGKIIVVQELLDGGQLFDHVLASSGLSEAEARNMVTCVGNALMGLHKRGIVYRDLKPEQILARSKAGKDGMPRDYVLFGFFLAGRCQEGKEECREPLGTPNYVAPEVLQSLPYGHAVDVWGLGVVLYIALCGFPPFYDEDDDLGRLYRKIKAGKYEMPSPYWDEVSDEAKDLIRCMLTVDPKKRISLPDVFKHPWMKAGARSSDTKKAGASKADPAAGSAGGGGTKGT